MNISVPGLDFGHTISTHLICSGGEYCGGSCWATCVVSREGEEVGREGVISLLFLIYSLIIYLINNFQLSSFHHFSALGLSFSFLA